MKQYSVIVGIPAHNEEKSIENILNVLIKQQRENFVLKKIVIFSDGSDDRTNDLVKKRSNKLIQLLESKKRIGKTNGIKRIGKTNGIKKLLSFARRKNADFLIIIDADLKIPNTYALKKLVENISSDKDIAAASGNVMPLEPQNFMQKISYFGFWLHKKTVEKLKDKSLYFKSGDAFIILRVNDFQEKRIKKFSYMHDEFYYLYCKKFGKRFSHEKNAKAKYLQPSNFKDYIHQMTRYISKHMSHEENIMLNNATFQIPSSQKLSTFIAFVKKDYFIGILYFLIQAYCHVLLRLNATRFNNSWKQIKSTK